MKSDGRRLARHGFGRTSPELIRGSAEHRDKYGGPPPRGSPRHLWRSWTSARSQGASDAMPGRQLTERGLTRFGARAVLRSRTYGFVLSKGRRLDNALELGEEVPMLLSEVSNHPRVVDELLEVGAGQGQLEHRSTVRIFA